MTRRRMFFSRLLMASVAITLPLVALVGYLLFEQHRAAEDAAYRAIAGQAADSAAEVDELLRRAERLLALLTVRPEVMKADADACPAALQGVAGLDSLYSDFIVFDLAGRVACSTLPPQASAALGSGQAPWFRSAMSAGAFHVGQPLEQSVAGRRVAVLSVPLRDADGRIGGLVGVTLDLEMLAERLAPGLPAGGTLALVQDGSLVMTRYPDAAAWIGRRTPASVESARLRNPQGVVVIAGGDRVTRAFAASFLQHAGLRTAAGIPTDVVFARSLEAQRRSYVVASLSLLLAAGLAFYAARWLSRPVRSLSVTVRAWAAGSNEARADETLPGEFRKLALEFNRMIDAKAASEGSLRESEARYATMLDSVDLLAVTVDTHYRLVYCNDALLRLTGWRRDEIIGKSWSDVFLPAEEAQLRAFLKHKMAQGDPPGRHENEILMKDGTRRRIRWANATLRSPAGVPIGAASIGEDITDRRGSELAQQAREVADSANRAKTAFLARMSHELRTPLNAVLGFSQLLQMNASDRLDAAQRRHLELIIAAGSQLRGLIDDLLDVSRIERGHLTIDAQEVELCGLLYSVLRMIESNASRDNITLRAAFADKAPLTIRTDALRLRQITSNVLSNAVKYNRAGGEVSVDIVREPGEVGIVITDTGIGMDEAQLGALFEPFNRLGRERSGIEGTGIGMTLSLELVRMLGGELVVRSEVGRGTVVRISLPDSAQPQAAAAVRLPPMAADVREAAPPSGRVLCIEDNEISVALIEALLLPWPGVELLVANDGQSGLGLARQHRPHVILLDVELPDTDGISLLATLTSDAATSGIPVVMVSASAMPDEVAAAKRHGARDYWTKPLDREQFIRGMRALLSEHLSSSAR